MLEVRLRPDGSVAAVTSIPAGEDRTVLPLDGLPLGLGGELDRGSPSRSAAEAWRGGFSFACWDRERETLHAYRDHYGARPLYYHAASGRLLLACEIPEIVRRLGSAPPLEETSVMEYLAAGTMSDDRTFHHGIKRVPAASTLSAGPGGMTVERKSSPLPVWL